MRSGLASHDCGQEHIQTLSVHGHTAFQESLGDQKTWLLVSSTNKALEVFVSVPGAYPPLSSYLQARHRLSGAQLNSENKTLIAADSRAPVGVLPGACSCVWLGQGVSGMINKCAHSHQPAIHS